MQRLLMLCVFLSFVLLSFSQVKNLEKDNGYNHFFYPNGQVSSEGKMVNGQPDGFWKSYFVDGTLKSEGVRIGGRLDSVWIFYAENGLISKKINYLNGQKNGYLYSFESIDSIPNSLLNYLYSEELYLNSHRNGISNYFHVNGEVQRSVEFVDGKKHGFTREYSSNGDLLTIIQYRHGKEIDRQSINRIRDSLKVGVWKEFYSNGKLKKEENYIRGRLHGTIREYDFLGELVYAHRYENGVLVDSVLDIKSEINIVEEFFNKRDTLGNFIKKSSGGFVQGKPIGVHRTYDSLGRVNSSKMYDSNGNLIGSGIVNIEGDRVGSWKFYYSSGELKSEGKYRKNRRVGTWIYYFVNGKVEQKGIFQAGRPNGEWSWYYESGKPKRVDNYRFGKEDGDIIEYCENGNTILTGNYMQGDRVGSWFFDFGMHTEHGKYEENEKVGNWNYFFKNNKIYFEGNYEQGKEDGVHIFYYKNGKVKEKRFYTFGLKNNNWEYYDYYGSLIKILTFDNDKLIKIDGISVLTE